MNHQLTALGSQVTNPLILYIKVPAPKMKLGGTFEIIHIISSLCLFPLIVHLSCMVPLHHLCYCRSHRSKLFPWAAPTIFRIEKIVQINAWVVPVLFWRKKWFKSSVVRTKTMEDKGKNGSSSLLKGNAN